MAEKQWAGTTYGSGDMHDKLVRCLCFIDARFLYVIAYVFVVPICIILNDSRRTSYSFFRERLHYGIFKSAWKMYVNHCKFAEVVIDKFAMYAGKKFKITIDGIEYFQKLASKPEGFIHMSSHIGNYEIAGYSLVSENKTINAVVFEHEKEFVMKNRTNMFDKTNIKMIALKENMEHLFEIDHALYEGNIVSFPTDRFMGNTKYIECEFLGGIAKFPQGPFSVATMRGLDVLAVNVMKDGWQRYRIFVRPLEYDKTLRRKEQIMQLSSLYVKELETCIKQYPTQWYNFYDFWN